MKQESGRMLFFQLMEKQSEEDKEVGGGLVCWARIDVTAINSNIVKQVFMIL